MKFDYEGTYPKPPEMHLRARLGWEYFFGNSPDWACTRTEDGAWILTDERCDLDHAFVHPDDDALIEWLDLVVREHLEDDPENFLENFVIVKELMNPEVAAVMKKIIMGVMELVESYILDISSYAYILTVLGNYIVYNSYHNYFLWI